MQDYARTLQGHLQGGAGRTQRRHPRTRHQGPRHPDRSLQGLQGHPLQCPNDRAHDTPVCRARRGLHRTPAHRHGASLPLRPRL